jgi:hypothetical protein
MIEHACKQIEKIAKLEQKQTDTSEEIKDIKETIKYNTRWVMGVLFTSLLTLAGIIIGFLKN